jgi:hypothetical protein
MKVEDVWKYKYKYLIFPIFPACLGGNLFFSKFLTSHSNIIEIDTETFSRTDCISWASTVCREHGPVIPFLSR